jgi:hypothetical protein
LDEEGRLMAVTFGIPKNGSDPGVSLDKFGYHVHLDEVKKFDQVRPGEPPPFIPDPWPAAVASALLDLDGDGVPDTLTFMTTKNKPLTGYQCDLAESSSPKFDARKFGDPEMRKLWHFQFGYVRSPVSRTFYDTKNSGKIDLILSDFNGDGIADLMLRLENGAWKVSQPKGQKMLDASLFSDPKLAERWTKIQQRNANANKPAPAPIAPKTPAKTS